MSPTPKTEADLRAWEEKKGFKGVISNGGFAIVRKCVECDQPTRSFDETHCGKHGGTRRVRDGSYRNRGQIEIRDGETIFRDSGFRQRLRTDIPLE